MREIDTSKLGPIRIDYSREPVREQLARMALEVFIGERMATFEIGRNGEWRRRGLELADKVIGRFPNVLIVPGKD